MKKYSLPMTGLVLGMLFLYACNGKQQAERAEKAVSRTDEASAVQALLNIARTETQFSLTHAGEYGMFDDLVKENFLDKRFSGHSPELAGYVFTIRLRPQAGGESAEFAVNADPKQTEGAAPTSARHLYIDSSNVVRANSRQPATLNDPPLQ
jgi:hypothetical protein